MKKTFIACLALFLLASSAFALGPVPVNLTLGAAGSSLGAGMNVGLDIGINLPVLPSFIIEADSSGMIIPLVFVNAATAASRIGLAERFDIVGDTFRVKVGVGAATITTDTNFVWGGETLKGSYSTSYLSITPELSLLGIGLYARFTGMPIPQGTVGEIDLGLLASF